MASNSSDLPLYIDTPLAVLPTPKFESGKVYPLEPNMPALDLKQLYRQIRLQKKHHA